jgi:hypothetical protein
MVSSDSKKVGLRLESYKQNTNVSGSNSQRAIINQLTNSLIIVPHQKQAQVSTRNLK